MATRFNWDQWDTTVTNPDGTVEGDIYRKDHTYACSNQVSGETITPTAGPLPITPALSGCQLFMPPRINDFRIIESVEIEFTLYGEGAIR